MKIKIREGNDFDVVWAIKRAGLPEDLSTAINMRLTLVVYGTTIEHSLFTVTDNVLSINIPREVATIKGDYRLVFEYTLPDAGQPDGDLKCKTDVVPFRIVPFTADADDVYTIDTSSDVLFGFKGDKGNDGDDAYQIWLDLGNVGTYEDFITYLRQPAVDAGASISELEAVIQSNETIRVDAEGERISAEILRLSAESGRAEAEGLRDVAEEQRIAAEGVRDDNEGDRITAESDRADAEELRDSAELIRLQSEIGRNTAEGLRVNAETGRNTAEGLRASAETGRNTAEGTRVTQESARQTNTATAISEANEAAEAADTARVNLTNAVNGKLGEADDKIEEMDTTLSTYDGRVTQVESDISQLAGDVKDTTEKAGASSLAELNARLLALEKIISSSLRSTIEVTKEFNVWGKTNLILTGSGAATFAPDFVGQKYIDTTNSNVYVAVGVSTAGNWKLV
jgi:hypothetical protein